MHDASIDFKRMADFPELGWLCIISTSSESREECSARMLELLSLGGLPLAFDMLRNGDFSGVDYGSGEGWHARLTYHVASPIWPSPTTIQPQRMRGQSQTGWEASRRDAHAAVQGLIAPSSVQCERLGDAAVSNAIAAMRTGASHIGDDRH
jgi:hypothetical protein